MNIDLSVKMHTYDSTVPLNQLQSGWYMEELVENFTDVTIYVLRPNGKMYTVPPLYNTPVQEKKVIFRSLIRDGRPDTGCFASKCPIMEEIIDFDRLSVGPYFSSEMGMAVSLDIYKEQMLTNNYLSKDYVDNKLRERVDERMRTGHMLPMTIRANAHDTSIKFLYVHINNHISSIVVEHNNDEKEILEFCFNKNNLYERVTVTDLDWSNLAIREEEMVDDIWVFGTDEEKVREKLKEKIEDDKFRMTPSEVKYKIEQSTESIKQELDNTTTILEQTKKELQIAKQDLETTKSELNKANDVSRVSTAQEINAMKLASTAEEIRLTNERRMLAREQAEFDRRIEREKAEAEQKIQETKVRKEEVSVSKAEVDNLSTTVKAAAVITPALLGAGMWVMSQSNSSGIIGAAASTMAAVSTPVCIGVAAATAVAGVVLSEPVKELCENIVPYAKRAIEGCKSICKGVINGIGTILNGAVSIMKNAFNIISEGVSGIGRFISDIFS